MSSPDRPKNGSDQPSSRAIAALIAILLALAIGVALGAEALNNSVERTITVMVCERGTRQDPDDAFSVRTDNGTFDLHDATIDGEELLSGDAVKALKDGTVYEITTSGAGFFPFGDPKIEEATAVDETSTHGGCGG